jgi:pilus assembly protein CpaB
VPIALAAALLISGGCTYLLGRKLNVDSFKRQQYLLHYVAPAHALAPGQVLQAGDLGWTEWPQADALKGAMTDQAVVVGRAVLYPVEQGQPILERDLGAPGAGGGLGSRIPRGMRALALRSDEVVGVAGFLAPGSRLDVLVTYHNLQSSDALTATVVQNAEVLASGQQAEPDPAGKPSIATVVTLLLTPLEAERAVAASTQGAIHFVLRNSMDKEEVKSAPVSLSWLGSDPGVRSSLPAKNVSPRETNDEAGATRRPVQPFRFRQQSVGDGIETVFGAEDRFAGQSRSLGTDTTGAALAVAAAGLANQASRPLGAGSQP